MKRPTRRRGPVQDPKPESAPSRTQASLLDRLHALVARADAGDRRALADLRQMLDENAAIWRYAGDLAALAERAWIALIASGHRLVTESITRQLAAMRAELSGPHPTATETLLVEQVAICWLAMQHAELHAADSGAVSLSQATIKVKRIESAQRRYFAALKLLSLLRARMPQGLAPLNGLRLYRNKVKQA